MEPNKILKSDILDLLFEDRNKEYGAYELRKTYNKRITAALLITAGAALLIFLSSFLAKSMDGDDDAKLNIKEMVLEDIQQEEEEKPEPPPPPPPPQQPPPQVEMTKFTPPVIKKDEEVKQDEIPPEVEELEDTKIDVVSQEGIKDIGIATPPPAVENKVVEAPKEDPNQVFTKVEIEAAFAGDWTKFLLRNLNGQVASDNGAPAGQYTVVVNFIVERDGTVSDVRATTNHGFGMEEEAIRAIKKAPKWTPAVQNGRQVRAYRKQPITFLVQEE